MIGLSQEALSITLGKDRRWIRDVIREHDIQPIEEQTYKDGRRVCKYMPADVYRAIAPDDYGSAIKLVTMLAASLLHPESNLMRAILATLPAKTDPVLELSRVINAGWDDVAIFLETDAE
jgi:hypothetical protein